MVVSLEMGWRHLLFENWPVDTSVVDTHLPGELEPDVFDGSAWLSVVPYTNVAVRPRGVPEPLGVRLPELNLRTYVTYRGSPGVYFFSLDAEGISGVLGARAFQYLPYYYARISLETSDGVVCFGSRRRHPGARPARYEATYQPAGESMSAPEDTLTEFLLERYRFYTQAPDGTLRYADIEHEPWTVYPAVVDVETNTLFSANGFTRPDTDPVRYYSPGIDVVASRSKRA